MSPQDLDNLFKDHLSPLESNPPGVEADIPARWNRVEAQLDNTGRRRVFIWLGVAASLALVFVLIRYLMPSGATAPEPQEMAVVATPDTLREICMEMAPELPAEPAMHFLYEGHGCILAEADGMIIESHIHDYQMADAHESYKIISEQIQGVSLSKAKHKKRGPKVKRVKTPKAKISKAERKANRKARRYLKKHPELVHAPIEGPGVEEYAPLIENEFRAVKQEPLSTFSIDVDKASYTNIRRQIMQESHLPHKDAVRIEEMVNYFDYDYKTPSGDVPFEVNTEMSECPWNTQHQLLMIGMQGKVIPTEDLPASNLVFLLDVSGSMQDPNKLPLVKTSIRKLVNQLRPDDKVSMVVYAGAAGLVLPPTSGDHKGDILAALDRLEAGGSTAGGAGIELAYATAKENFMPNGNNRIILCSDGDFNVGINSEAGLEELITRKREEGIFLSVLGFGTGNYKDSKMELLADKGNGNYGYIDNEGEAERTFVKEFGATLFTIAKDVKLQIEFNPAQVKAYRLIGYENRMLRNEDFANDKIDAGELGAGHRVTALYEIIPASSHEQIPGTVNLRYQQTLPSQNKNATRELMFVKLRYKEPSGTQSKLVEIPVEYAPVARDAVSDNFQWASAVATFGLILRESRFAAGADYDLALELAEHAPGTAGSSIREEFVEMVRKAKNVTMEAKK